MSTEKQIAEAAAATLNAAFRGNGSADAELLDGSWYVVTRGTGEGPAFAYDPEDIGEIDPDSFDYSMWCNESGQPITDKAVAVALYLESGELLGEAGACNPVLSKEEIALLDIVRGIER